MDNNKETISRLKFIGKIQIGDKVNLRYMYIQNDGLITQLSRTICQDNRSKTLTFLQDTINKSFEILKYYQNSEISNITGNPLLRENNPDINENFESTNPLKKSETVSCLQNYNILYLTILCILIVIYFIKSKK